MQQFKEEVDKYLTGNSEPSELIYFKLFKSQVPVIEQALETATRMLGSDSSRGYCLEMICADFLAGVSAHEDLGPKADGSASESELQQEPLDARLATLARDSWRCQQCGRIGNSEVHHQTFRSHGGDDDPGNLISLCADCHRAAHEQ